ncbi:MAG TPA: hypothetical protein V6C95_00915 [Coleofasciculaceae cyanobacterium]
MSSGTSLRLLKEYRDRNNSVLIRFKKPNILTCNNRPLPTATVEAFLAIYTLLETRILL